MEDAKNHEDIFNQGVIELEEPIHHGYNAEWILRNDIARREDANVYQEALDACKGKIWCKKKDFKFLNYKTRKWYVANPALKKINKAKYDALSPSAKKFFHEDISTKKNHFYKDKDYICTLSFELVVKITKAYITHRTEHDGTLYKKKAEIEKQMYDISPNPWGYQRTGDKWWQRHQDRKAKLAEERKIVDVAKVYKTTGDKKDLLDIG